MGDYVKRETVSLGLATKVKRRNFDAIDLQDAQKFICDLPSEDVQPVVRGEWLISNILDYRGRITGRKCIICSNCRKTVDEIAWMERLCLPDFCSLCGADMRPRPRQGDS